MASSDVAEGEKITAPYGSWKSPITADVVSGAEKRLGGIAVDGDGRLVWIETRPDDGGYGIQFRFWFSFGVRLKTVMFCATNAGKDE